MMLIFIAFRWMHNHLEVAMVGAKTDLTYDYEVKPVLHLCILSFRVTKK